MLNLENYRFLDVIPENIWQMLPGGPEAKYHGEVWQYMGTDDRFGHHFRHRNHPDYKDRMIVFVKETDIGAKLIIPDRKSW